MWSAAHDVGFNVQALVRTIKFMSIWESVFRATRAEREDSLEDTPFLRDHVPASPNSDAASLLATRRAEPRSGSRCDSIRARHCRSTGFPGTTRRVKAASSPGELGTPTPVLKDLVSIVKLEMLAAVGTHVSLALIACGDPGNQIEQEPEVCGPAVEFLVCAVR